MPVRYLSVCSGIEAATVAWHPLGWEPLAFSDIEPFPRAVLAHHYPDVPCHGDFTLLRDQHWIIGADVLVGGTPCQAFSVAGLRNSLSDQRGNLSLEFVRLGDAIDDLRLSAGGPPCVIVWENVPGVLSVKDNAFGCFLAALAGAEAPLVPPRGKWTNAGLVAGPKRQVAWRILDAQYFGVAQRRRRLFVVASAGAGFDPAQVLLVEQGVRRDTPPRRQTGEDASAGASGRAGERSHWDGVEHPHPTLNQSAKSSGGVGASNQELFSQRGAYLVPSTGEVSHCLNAGGMGRQDYETETLITHSLRAEGFDASEDGTGRGTPLVPVAYRTTGNDGVYETGDVVHALTTATDPNSHVIGFSAKDHGADATLDLSPTLRSLGAYNANGGGQMGVAYAFQPRIAPNGRGDMGDVVNALNAQSGETGKGDAAPCVAVGFQSSQSGVRLVDTHATLDANNGPRRHNGVVQHMAVRRLTPTECSRLQGFPDDYLTSVTWRGKCPPPDGPMYKALGNSMAVPVMAWIGRRIAGVLGGSRG